MLVAVAIIVFLILLTALYVAAEFAAVGARRSRLRRMAEDGNRSPRGSCRSSKTATSSIATSPPPRSASRSPA